MAAIEAAAAPGLQTLVWNGPLGAFETPPFDAATNAVAQAVAALTQSAGLKSIAGGGDTVSALSHAGVVDRMTYVSTAGGAFLEWLEGKTLPGVAALETAEGGVTRCDAARRRIDCGCPRSCLITSGGW